MIQPDACGRIDCEYCGHKHHFRAPCDPLPPNPADAPPIAHGRMMGAGYVPFGESGPPQRVLRQPSSVQPPATAAPPPIGCVCPPAANLACQRPDCPRKPPPAMPARGGS